MEDLGNPNRNSAGNITAMIANQQIELQIKIKFLQRMWQHLKRCHLPTNGESVRDVNGRTNDAQRSFCSEQPRKEPVLLRSTIAGQNKCLVLFDSKQPEQEKS